MRLLPLVEKVCPPFCRPALDRVKNSPIGRRIVGNSFWAIIGTGAAKAFTLLALILTARILGKEGFGDFGFVRATAMTFITFSSFGVGLTATKYIAEFLQSDKERAGRIIGLSYLFTFVSSLLVATVFYCAVPWLCETQLKTPHLVGEMRLGAPLLFLLTMMGTQGGVMAGFQDFRGLAGATFVSSVLSVPLYALGAYWGGVWGALIGLSVATLLNIAVNSGFIFRNVRKYGLRYSFVESYREWPVLWKFSLPTLLCSITYSCLFWLCLFLLRSQTDGAAELGIFSAAFDIYVIMIFVSVHLAPVFLSSLSELYGKKDYGRYAKTVSSYVRFSLLFASLLAVPVIFFSRTILSAYGAEFADGASVLSLLAFVMLTGVVCTVVDQVVASMGKMWFNYAYCLAGGIVMLSTCHYCLSCGMGSFSIAVAMLAGNLTRLVIIVSYMAINKIRTKEIAGK